MKMLITGGHLTPALSFIDFVRSTHPQDKLVFAGREFSQDALRQKAIERYEVEKRNIQFISFEAVRLGSTFGSNFFGNLRRFFISFGKAKALLKKQRPNAVLSFGGYVAVPFALAAHSLRIPVVSHEQTLTNGFANRLISWVATAIAISFPESRQRLFASKTKLTGNPLRAGVFRSRHPRPKWLSATLAKPIMMIMGGNQGSRTINNAIQAALPELLVHWIVVHQCGQPTTEERTRETLERQRQRLPEELQSDYFVFEWIDESDLFWLYHHAFCAISRAGANSVQELAAARLPAILVPLPSSRLDEQRKNAQWLRRLGGAIIVEQSVLNTQTLLSALEKLQTMAPTMRTNLAAVTLPENAAQQLYTVVTEAVSSP